MTSAPATVLASEAHVMASHHTGRTYRITIGLPLRFTSSPRCLRPKRFFQFHPESLRYFHR